jgi:diguanylate cyclase (GGDEF)-like protein
MRSETGTRYEQVSDSAVARQLRAGFRWLRFDAPLEREFQQAQFTANRERVRFNLVLAAVLVAAFAVMDRWLLGSATQFIPDILRFGVLLPLILLAIVCIQSRPAPRVYPLAIQIIAPVAGICVVLIETRAARAGVQLVFAAVVIATTYIYFLTGMRFYAALRSNLVVLATYLAVALAADLPEQQVAYSGTLLVLANLVGAAVCYNLETANRISYLEARLLGEMVARDGLTGIHNRRMFDERIAELWQQALRGQVPLAMLLIDIDCFKPFNDRYGHQAGDEALRRVAAVLSRVARRPLDVTARFGGEEFATVLYDVERSFVIEVAEGIRAEIEAMAVPHERSTAGPVLTVSVGGACVRPRPGRHHQGLIQLADQALYAAKHQGRNRILVMESEYADLKTGEFQHS